MKLRMDSGCSSIIMYIVQTSPYTMQITYQNLYEMQMLLFALLNTLVCKGNHFFLHASVSTCPPVTHSTGSKIFDAISLPTTQSSIPLNSITQINTEACNLSLHHYCDSQKPFYVSCNGIFVTY